MRIHICTFRRQEWLGRLLFIAFTCSLLYQPAAAEKARRKGQPPEAELHINVVVAPVIFPPHRKDRDQDQNRDRDEAAILYNLSPSMEKLSISQEMRILAVDGGKRAQVQLTTVVMK
jgi:hypothetical protein